MKQLFKIVFLILSISVFSQTDINKLDANGKKIGLWKGVFEDTKRPRYEGTFDHDKEVGLFKFFDNTKASNLIATREFNSKDNSAYTIFYDFNKNKISEGKVLNKLYEGLWIYYHKGSTVIMTSENYKNGKLNGTKTVNFKSGKPAEISNYKNGILDGVYIKYDESGIALEESFYINGELSGETTYRAPDGLVVAKGKFRKGVKVGIWQFFENGKLESEDNFDQPIRKIAKRKK
jgi:antitoxin component YwqK of YwqJK toxin-antitoxin module